MRAELQSGGVVILISMKAGAGLVEIGSRHSSGGELLLQVVARTHKHLSLCEDCCLKRRAEMLISDMTCQGILHCVLLYKENIKNLFSVQQHC